VTISVRRVVGAACSLIGGIIPFFMMSSYLYPGSTSSLSTSLPLSPNLDPTSLVQSLISGSIPPSFTGAFSSLGSIANILPFAVAGGSSMVIWMIVQQVLGRAQSFTSSNSIQSSNPADLMKNFGMNIPSFSTQSNLNVPTPKLPDDITKAQFTILKSFQQGYKKSKDMEKILFMDKKDIEKEISALKTNDYVTKNNKLTSKAMELLSP